MKLYRLAEAFTVLSMAGLAGWSFGRLQVNNFELAEAWYEANVHTYDLARAQRPTRRASPTIAPPSSCAVARDRILRPDERELSRAARVVPAFVEGRPRGFRLYAIAPGSLFAALGLRNGDRIQRINGFDLSHPDHALEAYAALRKAAALVIDLERAGAPVQLTCALR